MPMQRREERRSRLDPGSKQTKTKTPKRNSPDAKVCLPNTIKNQCNKQHIKIPNQDRHKDRKKVRAKELIKLGIEPRFSARRHPRNLQGTISACTPGVTKIEEVLQVLFSWGTFYH